MNVRIDIIMLFFFFLWITGEMTVLYLFTRVRFNWDEVDFSIFSTYMMVTNLLGNKNAAVVFIPPNYHCGIFNKFFNLIVYYM